MRIYYLTGGDYTNPRYQAAENIAARYAGNIWNSRYGRELREAQFAGLPMTNALAYNEISNRLNTTQIPQSVYMRGAMGTAK